MRKWWSLSSASSLWGFEHAVHVGPWKCKRVRTHIMITLSSFLLLQNCYLICGSPWNQHGLLIVSPGLYDKGGQTSFHAAKRTGLAWKLRVPKSCSFGLGVIRTRSPTVPSWVPFSWRPKPKEESWERRRGRGASSITLTFESDSPFVIIHFPFKRRWQDLSSFFLHLFSSSYQSNDMISRTSLSMERSADKNPPTFCQAFCSILVSNSKRGRARPLQRRRAPL